MRRSVILALTLTYLTGTAVTPIFAQDVGSGSADTSKKKKKKTTTPPKPPPK